MTDLTIGNDTPRWLKRTVYFLYNSGGIRKGASGNNIYYKTYEQAQKALCKLQGG